MVNLYLTAELEWSCAEGWHCVRIPWQVETFTEMNTPLCLAGHGLEISSEIEKEYLRSFHPKHASYRPIFNPLI